MVASLLDACIIKDVPQPIIISESGRALGSHHSLVVFEALTASDPNCLPGGISLEALANEVLPGGMDLCIDPGGSGQDLVPYFLRTFLQVYLEIDRLNIKESINDAKQFKREASSLFKLGCLNLKERAFVEALYSATCQRAIGLARETSPKVAPLAPETELVEASIATYHVNLSVFRSAPDIWAISQLFPIIPLHRLREEPQNWAILADLTCDSDGKIDSFLGDENQGTSRALRVHHLKENEKYYLGLFLSGVYQVKSPLKSQDSIIGM